MAQEGTATTSPCPACGGTTASLTIEFREPVVLDGEVMIEGVIVAACCSSCKGAINFDEQPVFTLFGETVDDDG